MKPTTGRRTWVKLYAEDWLDGTTRYQMSGNQRAFWIDLLAMAGRGRVGGIVCAGKDGDKLIGYPIEKFQALSPEPLDVLKTFELFERTGKIRVESENNEYGLTLYVIHILNWTKYQSEYERVKPYRRNATEKVQPKSQPKSQESHSTEVEVDSDLEVETETSSKTPNASRNGGCPTLAIPDWIPVPEWTAFLKQLRGKVTTQRIELYIKQLADFPRAEVKSILEQSTRNGWSHLKLVVRDSHRSAAERTLHNMKAVGLDPNKTSFADVFNSLKKPPE